MISMTGYAYREKTGQDFSVLVEIKGFNSRYLDISVNLPPWLSTLEMKIREQISSCCSRGKIDIFLRVREYNTPISINVNTNAAKAYFDAIKTLADNLSLDEKPGLDSLLQLQIDGILEIEKNRDDQRYWEEINPLLQETLQAFCAERDREGKHTQNDILSKLDMIETSVKTIRDFVPVIEQTIKDNIKTRFAEVLGNQINQIDENRILAETAAQLVKCTISEEISRLDSHLGEFRTEAVKNPASGKKLDFLSQEIHREINTIGSKSTIIEVSSEVVDKKEALENIREQLRNVE
jgi:uncharacterized protein (TIGR00255 family)